jgi:hypothetical protein
MSDVVAGLPADDLAAMGVNVGDVETWSLISNRHGHSVYRLRYDGRSAILKWLGDSPQRIEVQAYGLLRRLGVPTPRVYGRLPHALLLEDLEAGSFWRLAGEADVDDPAVGSAVAEWYCALHAAGDRLREGDGFPAFLARETDELTAERVLNIGRHLGLEHHAVWRMAADAVAALVQAQRALPETLNYCDFHWSNLALSQTGTPRRALVFDYGLLGVGPRYGDVRNVAGSLGLCAGAVFMEALGPLDEREVLLDAPLATLHALHVAAQRPRLPGWAQEPLHQATDGTLAWQIQRAMSEAI